MIIAIDDLNAGVGVRSDGITPQVCAEVTRGRIRGKHVGGWSGHGSCCKCLLCRYNVVSLLCLGTDRKRRGNRIATCDDAEPVHHILVLDYYYSGSLSRCLITYIQGPLHQENGSWSGPPRYFMGPLPKSRCKPVRPKKPGCTHVLCHILVALCYSYIYSPYSPSRMGVIGSQYHTLVARARPRTSNA